MVIHVIDIRTVLYDYEPRIFGLFQTLVIHTSAGVSQNSALVSSFSHFMSLSALVSFFSMQSMLVFHKAVAHHSVS
jgi:hypothetical protein